MFQAIWRRRASVYRRLGKIDEAVTELSAHLDTFYTEVDGWLELADIYSSCQQYVLYLFFGLHSYISLLDTHTPYNP